MVQVTLARSFRANTLPSGGDSIDSDRAPGERSAAMIVLESQTSL